MFLLYIGNKNYSSWSLRPWVLMKAAGIPFDEVRITLDDHDTASRIGAKSPSGKVPCLHDGRMVVWDSLAICEYLAERYRGLWPEDPEARAWARCAAAEMHSGYAALRNEFGMNVRLRIARVPSAEVQADIARIGELWREGRARFGGGDGFLCGKFGIVDAFYCPVAFRFSTYGVALGPVESAYLQSLLRLPAMVDWASAAAAEPERIARYDAMALAPASTRAEQ